MTNLVLKTTISFRHSGDDAKDRLIAYHIAKLVVPKYMEVAEALRTERGVEVEVKCLKFSKHDGETLSVAHHLDGLDWKLADQVATDENRELATSGVEMFGGSGRTMLVDFVGISIRKSFSMSIDLDELYDAACDAAKKSPEVSSDRIAALIGDYRAPKLASKPVQPSATRVGNDESMEDIMASIRRILSEDAADAKPAPKADDDVGIKLETMASQVAAPARKHDPVLNQDEIDGLLGIKPAHKPAPNDDEPPVGPADFWSLSRKLDALALAVGFDGEKLVPKSPAPHRVEGQQDIRAITIALALLAGDTDKAADLSSRLLKMHGDGLTLLDVAAAIGRAAGTALPAPCR